MKKTILAATFVASLNSYAVLGPIPIYLNTEYRTTSPVIGNIASTLSFDAEDIKSSGATSLADFLLTVPSIEATNPPGNIPSIFIRGNEGAHTLLLVNGIKVANGGYANLDAVPLDSIEKIAIIKGPFSSLYGPGAIGGVISITTNNKQNTKSGNLSISYGTHNTQKLSLNASNNDENGYINIAVSEYSTDGINARVADTTGEKDGSDKKSLSISAGSKLSEQTDIEVNILNSSSDIRYDGVIYPPPTFAEVVTPGGDKPDNDLKQFNIKTTHKFSDNFKSIFDIKKQDANKQEKDFELTAITLLNEYDFDNSKLSFGLENETDKAITDNRVIKHKDIFAQYQMQLSHNDIVIGLRNIDHDKFGKDNTYNIGWGRNLNADLRLSATFGKAINLPNHYQNNLNLITGKTELQPEYGKNLEFGVDYKNITAKIYKSKIKNAFSYFDPDGVFNNNEYYINKGGIENKGIELSFENKLFDWNIATNLTYNKSIDSETKKDQGRRPDKTLNIIATNSYGKFDNKIQFIAKSKTWDNDANTTGQNAGYGLINLGTSYSYNNKTTLSLNINNALDKEYTVAKGYNQLGRTFNIGLNYSF
jgi:vitamin B12 transporter